MVDSIDISVHGSNLGSGNIAGNTAYAFSARLIALNFSSLGNAINIPLAQEPLRVTVLNETDTILWEWRRGMAATKTLKTTGTPTVAIDTGSAIVVTKQDPGKFLLALSATLAANGKALTVIIEA